MLRLQQIWGSGSHVDMGGALIWVSRLAMEPKGESSLSHMTTVPWKTRDFLEALGLMGPLRGISFDVMVHTQFSEWIGCPPLANGHPAGGGKLGHLSEADTPSSQNWANSARVLLADTF